MRGVSRSFGVHYIPDVGITAQKHVRKARPRLAKHPLRRLRRWLNRVMLRFFKNNPTHVCTVCATELRGYFEKKQGLCSDRADCLDNYWALRRATKPRHPALKRRAGDRPIYVHTPQAKKKGRVLNFTVPIHTTPQSDRAS